MSRTSGLDPLGRLLVRRLIEELRDRGASVFLNPHLLGEVEATCDRVAFVKRGAHDSRAVALRDASRLLAGRGDEDRSHRCSHARRVCARSVATCASIGGASCICAPSADRRRARDRALAGRAGHRHSRASAAAVVLSRTGSSRSWAKTRGRGSESERHPRRSLQLTLDRGAAADASCWQRSCAGSCFLVMFGLSPAYSNSERADRRSPLVQRQAGCCRFSRSGRAVCGQLPRHRAVRDAAGGHACPARSTPASIQTLASKPVRRADIVLGKWLVFWLMIAAYIVHSWRAASSAIMRTGFSGFRQQNLLPGAGR